MDEPATIRVDLHYRRGDGSVARLTLGRQVAPDPAAVAAAWAGLLDRLAELGDVLLGPPLHGDTDDAERTKQPPF